MRNPSSRSRLLAAAASLILVTGCSGGHTTLQALPKYDFNVDGGCPGGPAVTFSSSPSISGGEKEVYRLKRPQVSGDYAAQLAQQLGIDSAPTFIPGSADNFVHVSARWEAENTKAVLVVHEDYGIHFESKLPGVKGAPLPEKDAVETSRRFLQGAHLLPEADLSTTYKGDAATGIAEVRFQASGVDLGMPPGDDQTISVSVAPDANVTSLAYYWQEPQSMGTYPVISEAEARRRLANCDAFVWRHGDAMNVENVKLAYVGVPLTEPPYDYLVPAYVFTDPAGESGDWPPTQFALVPAIPDEHFD